MDRCGARASAQSSFRNGCDLVLETDASSETILVRGSVWHCHVKFF